MDPLGLYLMMSPARGACRLVRGAHAVDAELGAASVVFTIKCEQGTQHTRRALFVSASPLASLQRGPVVGRQPAQPQRRAKLALPDATAALVLHPREPRGCPQERVRDKRIV